MMADEKLAKCLKRLTKARDIARKFRKWIASSRCINDIPAVKEASFQTREDMLDGEERLDCAIRELEALISIVGIKEGLEEKVYPFEPKSKVDEIAEVIKSQFDDYIRSYGKPLRLGEIERQCVVRDVQFDICDLWSYIVINGLTKEEENELERKLKRRRNDNRR